MKWGSRSRRAARCAVSVRRIGYGGMASLCAACALLLVACAPSPVTSHHSGRTVVLTDSLLRVGGCDTLRLGRMRSGEQVRLPLWLENRTEHPVVLRNYERSCGCTALEYSAEPMLSGLGQAVTVTYDSRGEVGWQLRCLDLYFVGAAAPLRLLVEADVTAQ